MTREMEKQGCADQELERLRGQVDQVDRELAQLFLRRMELTGQIGSYKRERGLPVLDSRRETQVLQQVSEQTQDELRKRELAKLFEGLLAISRWDQRRLDREERPESGYCRCKAAMEHLRRPLEHPRVVYQGVAGAYSEMAARAFFGDGADCRGLEQFEDVFEAVHMGRADYAVVPIENSSTGAIRQVYELLSRYEHYIVGEDTVRVEHCLMAPHGATLDTITHVYSHEQGLFQSDRFLSGHPNWVQVPLGDTAGSAKFVAQTGDITKAAICSERAAQLYGLDILYRGTNHNSNNVTRFVVVSPVMELREGADKISAVLSLPHVVGSLHEILTIFTVNGLNLTKLESRPMPGRSWEYLFFLEFTGCLLQADMDGILQELSQAAAHLRILGNFKANL